LLKRKAILLKRKVNYRMKFFKFEDDESGGDDAGDEDWGDDEEPDDSGEEPEDSGDVSDE